MEANGERPDGGLASRVLPGALRRALVHVFGQGISGCMLVGGTALAGYYAGHRRSDGFQALAEQQPTPPIGALVRALRPSK